MMRKAIIILLTLASSIMLLAWISSYWLEFEFVEYRYEHQPMRTSWMYRSSGGGAWTTSVDGMISGDYISRVCLSLTGGIIGIHSQQQLQIPAKTVENGFDWGFASLRYGTWRTFSGFQHFYRYRSTFAVPFIILFAYPTVAFIRGPLRRYRRRRRGLCIRCGYNLEGNVSGVCSECGEAT